MLRGAGSTANAYPWLHRHCDSDGSHDRNLDGDRDGDDIGDHITNTDGDRHRGSWRSHADA